jgi:hypothetical protein
MILPISASQVTRISDMRHTYQLKTQNFSREEDCYYHKKNVITVRSDTGSSGKVPSKQGP